ncbi:MAG: hypothetical protein M0T85_01715 [Dehalococcoidales bacterium]|nr:hypothetical protein [Dehalococcoidales bacterium]
MAYPYDDIRRILGSMDGSWNHATDAQIYEKVCKQDCTLFVGSDPLRVALCGTATCPAPAKGSGDKGDNGGTNPAQPWGNSGIVNQVMDLVKKYPIPTAIVMYLLFVRRR